VQHLQSCYDPAEPGTSGVIIRIPQFAPALQQVAQMKLKGLVPNFNNPTAAVSELLGNLLGKQSGNQAEQQQSAPSQNPLQQFQGIFGKKRQRQPPKKRGKGHVSKIGADK